MTHRTENALWFICLCQISHERGLLVRIKHGTVLDHSSNNLLPFFLRVAFCGHPAQAVTVDAARF